MSRIWKFSLILLSLCLSLAARSAAQCGTPVFAPPGQITIGFPLDLILDSAPTITSSYYVDYCPPALQYVAEWYSSRSLNDEVNVYEQYLPLAGWSISENPRRHPWVVAIGGSKGSFFLLVNIVDCTVWPWSCGPQKTTGSQVAVSFVLDPPGPPDNLSAVVGDGSVILRWATPESIPEGYNIYVDQIIGGTPIDLGLLNSSGPVQGTHFVVNQLPAMGGPPQNGQLYRFRVTAVYISGESDPSMVLAQPSGFVAPPHPLHPILFLHGIDADASAWQSVAYFLSSTLNWTCGGTLSYGPNDNPLKDPPKLNDPTLFRTCGPNQPFLASGDYFTVNFGDKLANYSNGQGIFHQGYEVGGFIRQLKERRNLSIVAWSMGGLAARSYIQVSDPVAAPDQISDLITLGTPHWGVQRSSFLAPPLSLLLFAWWTDVPAMLTSRGLFDMDGGCVANGGTNETELSQFLQALDYNPMFGLPPSIRYVVVSGTPPAFLYLNDCVGLPPTIQTDLVVTTTSSTLAGILPTPEIWKALDKDDNHLELPNDVSAILCSLDPHCAEFQVLSPVDILVTAPNGSAISNNFTSMPGAEYSNVTDASGHETATVLIPFPQGGQYTITATPKAGAQPTDTFTILQTQDGVTTPIAQNMQIQNIPPAGFQTPVKNGSSLMVVSPASLNFGNVELGRPAKRVVTLENQGAKTAEIGPISYSVITGDASQFSFEHECPARVGAGKRCTIAVIFTPDAVGADAATLNIVTNVSDIPLEVPITAAGIKK